MDEKDMWFVLNVWFAGNFPSLPFSSLLLPSLLFPVGSNKENAGGRAFSLFERTPDPRRFRVSEPVDIPLKQICSKTGSARSFKMPYCAELFLGEGVFEVFFDTGWSRLVLNPKEEEGGMKERKKERKKEWRKEGRKEGRKERKKERRKEGKKERREEGKKEGRKEWKKERRKERRKKRKKDTVWKARPYHPYFFHYRTPCATSSKRVLKMLSFKSISQIIFV